jgi:SpoIID/LytB domain protein
MAYKKKPLNPLTLDHPDPHFPDPSTPAFSEPSITVGIMDHQTEVAGLFEGHYDVEGIGSLSGRFTAKVMAGIIALSDAYNREITRSSMIRCRARPDSLFHMANVTIGIDFHWERREEQIFRGSLTLRLRDDGTTAIINEINLEDYLKSVISSEMNSAAPEEFLKAHAILSRSWLLASLNRKNRLPRGSKSSGTVTEDEVIRWYDREDHDLYDVCADDHCQRYQGVTKIMSGQAEEVIRETRGVVITSGDNICDARYSKACGGLTENFETAWGDGHIPYLTSISDSPVQYHLIRKEEEVNRWILSEPAAYCNTKDEELLKKILPDFDRETQDFFRWKVEYSREELEGILQEKTGFDFGTLQAIIPLQRGPSGRISRLKLVGSKKSIIVGKELEIRRWLSKSHLYSSAFVVEAHHDERGEITRFVFHGAGWGHGVVLCQIGAAVMASKGFTAEEILKHYFPGTEIQRLY